MNRSLTPKKAKVSPFKNQAPNRSASSKSSLKKQTFIDPYIEDKLKKNRQKLTHTLDTHTMLIRSRNPIRCLQHNSAISIFCQTENKLLCTNCVFGRNQHRFHKMSPIDKSFDLIALNIEKMALSTNKQISAILNIKEVILNNLVLEEQDLHQTLTALSIRYAQAQQLLNDCLYSARQKLILSMQKIRAKHETVAMQLTFLQQIYNVEIPVQIDPSDFQSAQVLLYRHSLLSTINSQNKFEGNVWKDSLKEIYTQGEGEIQRINQINKQLKKIIEVHFCRTGQ